MGTCGGSLEKKQTVAAQFLHSFVPNFGPRETVALVRSERVLGACDNKGGGLLIDLLDGSPEVLLKRVHDGLHIGVLDVRIFPMIIFVVRVANAMTPRLLELLANVFQRVDHDAELAKPLVRDVLCAYCLNARFIFSST